jgi:hypothetical protein
VSLHGSVTQRITGSSRKERKKSGKLRIICRILVVVRIICLKWRIAAIPPDQPGGNAEFKGRSNEAGSEKTGFCYDSYRFYTKNGVDLSAGPFLYPFICNYIRILGI